MTTKQTLVIGIDGGGTKTEAILAVCELDTHPLTDSIWPSLKEIGRGIGGPSNPRAVGFSTAYVSIRDSIERAFSDAKLKLGPVAAIVMGLAGAGRPEEQAQILKWTREQNLAARVSITHDGELALAAGTSRGIGVALIAGTGSFAFGKNAHGDIARAGGWGYLLGDEGGGYWLGVEALRAVARAEDRRGPPTELSRHVFEMFNVSQMSEIIAKVYSPDCERRQIAALAKVVIEAADSGDQIANDLTDSAAAELADAITAVASELDFEASSCPLALAGGIMCGSSSMRVKLEKSCEEVNFAPANVTFVDHPAIGAVRLAGLIARRAPELENS